MKERPHDVLCLAVVSFNSTVPQAKSFVIGHLLRLQIYPSIQLNSALFCLS